MVKTEPNSSASFNQSPEYTKLNPLGKIPAFEGANGFVLSEVIALVVYGRFFISLFYLFILQTSVCLPYMMKKFILSVIPGRKNNVENPPTLKFLVTPLSGEISL